MEVIKGLTSVLYGQITLNRNIKADTKPPGLETSREIETQYGKRFRNITTRGITTKHSNTIADLRADI